MNTAPPKKTYYGVSLGILMLETYFERFNGDIGNARTWPFPIQYKIVKGASPDRITNLTTTDFLQPFLDAADELIAGGCDGITTTCGFLALYQRELSEHCAVPVATSALLQVPLVARILPKAKRPAIITFSSESLTTRHLTSVGVDPTTISWGTMINGARLEMAREPMVWWSLAAAFVFMFALVRAANLFADAVRDGFDPRVRV